MVQLARAKTGARVCWSERQRGSGLDSQTSASRQKSLASVQQGSLRDDQRHAMLGAAPTQAETPPSWASGRAPRCWCVGSPPSPRSSAPRQRARTTQRRRTRRTSGRLCPGVPGSTRRLHAELRSKTGRDAIVIDAAARGVAPRGEYPRHRPPPRRPRGLRPEGLVVVPQQSHAHACFVVDDIAAGDMRAWRCDRRHLVGAALALARRNCLAAVFVDGPERVQAVRGVVDHGSARTSSSIVEKLYGRFDPWVWSDVIARASSSTALTSRSPRRPPSPRSL